MRKKYRKNVRHEGKKHASGEHYRTIAKFQDPKIVYRVNISSKGQL